MAEIFKEYFAYSEYYNSALVSRHFKEIGSIKEEKVFDPLEEMKGYLSEILSNICLPKWFSREDVMKALLENAVKKINEDKLLKELNNAFTEKNIRKFRKIIMRILDNEIAKYTNRLKNLDKFSIVTRMNLPMLCIMKTFLDTQVSYLKWLKETYEKMLRIQSYKGFRKLKKKKIIDRRYLILINSITSLEYVALTEFTRIILTSILYNIKEIREDVFTNPYYCNFEKIPDNILEQLVYTFDDVVYRFRYELIRTTHVTISEADIDPFILELIRNEISG